MFRKHFPPHNSLFICTVAIPFVIRQRDAIEISFGRKICYAGICYEIAEVRSIYIESNKDFRFDGWVSVLIDILWLLNLKICAY